jgi:hypothetical protein
MCSCFSTYNLVIALPLILWLAYHIFPTTCSVPTISVLNLAISPHATQTCCSEADEDLGFFDEEF